MKRHRTSRMGVSRAKKETASEETSTDNNAVDGTESDVFQGDFKSQENDAFVKSPALGVDNSFNGIFSSYDYGADESDSDEERAIDEPLITEMGRSFIPEPEVFNAYPVEVQRKIMEWTDRDIKARRDDESRREDEMMRAEFAHKRTKQAIPAVIIILAIICAAVTGVMTRNPVFPIAFLIIPLAVIIGSVVSEKNANKNDESDNKHR